MPRPIPLFFLVLLVMITLAPAGAANDPAVPLPQRKTTPEVLERTQREQEQQAESLKQQAAQQEQALKELSQKLVTLNDQTDREEERLMDLDTEIRTLGTKQSDLVRAIDGQRSVLAELLVVMQRLRRLPAEALLFSAQSPASKAQQGVMLAHVTRTLQGTTDQLRDQLGQLESTEQTLALRRKAQETALEKVRGERRSIDTLMRERQKRIRATRDDLDRQEQALAAIAREALTLRDLMSTIARYNEEQARIRKTKDKRPASSRATSRQDLADERDAARTTTALNASGHRLPVRGAVTISYGGRNAQGIKNEGITLAARPGMIVSSPLAGRVKYTGPFKHYGNLTILEHPGKIHTLVAGTYKIDTVVGQDIAASEPIGRVLSNASAPTIYFEVRRRGTPVDPLTIITP